MFRCVKSEIPGVTLANDGQPPLAVVLAAVLVERGTVFCSCVLGLFGIVNAQFFAWSIQVNFNPEHKLQIWRGDRVSMFTQSHLVERLTELQT